MRFQGLVGSQPQSMPKGPRPVNRLCKYLPNLLKFISDRSSLAADILLGMRQMMYMLHKPKHILHTDSNISLRLSVSVSVSLTQRWRSREANSQSASQVIIASGSPFLQVSKGFESSALGSTVL